MYRYQSTKLPSSTLLKGVEQKLPPGFRDTDEDEDGSERAYVLGHIPPRTRDPDKYKTADDDINYRALCRGRDLLAAPERAHLKCHFSSLLLHPFYRLGPMKVEVAHRPPHQVIVFHDFVSHAEADEIVEQGSVSDQWVTEI